MITHADKSTLTYVHNPIRRSCVAQDVDTYEGFRQQVRQMRWACPRRVLEERNDEIFCRELKLGVTAPEAFKRSDV